MEDLKQTEFPEPEFCDEGQLGVDGNVYHSKVTVEGFQLGIGESVIILPEEGELTYIGKVVSLFESPEGEKNARVNWFQRREELDRVTRKYLLAREILLTESVTIVPIDAILKKITVHQSPTPLEDSVNKKSNLVTGEFFCNRGYLIGRGEFIALSTLNRLMKSTEYAVEKVDGTTKFDMARAKLQLNFVTAVAGRDHEIEEVTERIVNFIEKGGQGGCVYLSGVPGTGKTLVVREAMRRLAVKELSGEVQPFQFYEVNCLRLETPREIYSELWKVLTDEKLNPTAAQKALNDMFLTEVSPFYIVVLVDEIDVLLTPQQNELYCLMEWSSLPHAKFVVIAVANLMDLDSRLKPKIASRMGGESVKFAAYRDEQLKNIINSRVQDLNVFSEPAIKLCAKIISMNGGDARKALESCKRALELRGQNDEVKPDAIRKAITQISSIQAKALLAQLSQLQSVFLASLVIHLHNDERTTVPLQDVSKRTFQIMKQLGIKTFRPFMLLTIVNELVNLNIIRGNRDGAVMACSSISLVPFEQEVLGQLVKFPELEPLLKHLLE